MSMLRQTAKNLFAMTSFTLKPVILFAFTLALALLGPQPTWAKRNDNVPSMSDIPRLQAGLPPGTIAWATVDQLHPLQPQTGKREVRRKRKSFRDLLSENEEKFPKKLYKFLYRGGIIVPVIIGKTPKTDSRYGSQDFLGYNTDRTHSSNALADLIYKKYGKKGLSEPIYDENGRPLNFILVKVVEDRSKLAPSLFSKLMVREDHTYLRLWSRGRRGNTVITDIDFNELPEKVYETTDNPYRGLIGEAQNKHYVGKSDTDFSQFAQAEALYNGTDIKWDDISSEATDKQYDKALEQTEKFFDSRDAVGVPGANPTDLPRSCKAIFKS
jgi:hypothetical protein